MAAEASVSMKTAQGMAHHLRRVMAGDTPSSFVGPVEMDETYIGGQRKNKRLHIRRIQGKHGHGTDKLPIFGVFDRASGSVIVFVEPKKLDIRFILQMLRERVVSSAVVLTDGFKMYRGIQKRGFRHAFVDHLQGEYVRGDVHTNNIEGFWGVLKRKLACIGGMRRDRLYLFVAEIVWKFDHRHDSLEYQERALLELVLRH